MMVFFSNGAEGADYEKRYCERCIHYGPEDGPGCPVFGARLLHNYAERDNQGSIVHLLIPRSADGLTNEPCRMFIEVGKWTHTGRVNSREAKLWEVKLGKAGDLLFLRPDSQMTAHDF
jgi:hypothetical protein